MEIDINKISSVEFEDQTSLGFFHFKSEYPLVLEQSEVKIVSGFGTSENKEIAFQKSLYELYERITFFKSSLKLGVNSSSGFASHYDDQISMRNAINELIERDVFFEYWLNYRSPRWFDILTELNFHQNLMKMNDFCQKEFFELKIGIGLEKSSVLVLFGIVHDLKNEFGGFINTTACVDISNGIDSIIYTLSRYLTIIANRKKNNLPLFQNIVTPKIPTDHFEYYLNPLNFERIKWLLNPGSSNLWNSRYDCIEVQKIDMNIQFPTKCTIFFASSNNLQTYFSGETTESKLCAHNRIKIDKLNLEIHPLP